MKCLLVFLASLSAFAQQPRLSNARLETVPRSGALDAQIRQLASKGEALWIGYSVPRVPNAGQSCCYWDDGYQSSRGCGLEGNTMRPAAATPPGPVLLEGPSHTTVLLRYEAGALTRVRSYSVDCELDGGGLRVAWLTGVAPAESIALLGSLGEEHKRSTLRIIASHADPQVTKMIEDVATDAGTTDSLRNTAISLLGSLRGSAGYEALMRLMARNSTDEFAARSRERAVAALGANSDTRATEALRNAATKDRSTRVRSEAVSALARKSGASTTILEVARKDADAGVRKRAVQALSRVRSDEGVPLLIEIARDRNTEPALRKEAISGLGRVRDPKAQAYLQDLLSR
jgi:HEAT repeat protein